MKIENVDDLLVHSKEGFIFNDIFIPYIAPAGN